MRRVLASIALLFLLSAVAAPFLTSIGGSATCATTCRDDCAPGCARCTCAHRLLSAALGGASTSDRDALAPERLSASHGRPRAGVLRRPYRPPRA